VFNDPEFHKRLLKLVGEESTSAMPADTEELIKDLPRAPEIVVLFKKRAL
jgi:hypothetical protein